MIKRKKANIVFIILYLTISYISIQFLSCDAKLTSPPSTDMPTNLELEKINEGTVELTWSYLVTTDDTIRYVIAKKTGEEEWNENYSNIYDKIFYDDINTVDSLVYAYKVKVHNVTQNEYSSFTEAVAYFSEQTTPSNLNITQNSETQLRLEWEDNCIGEDGYKLDKKVGNNPWQNNYMILNSNSTYCNDNVTLFDTVYYRISAFLGESKSNSIQNNFFPTLLAPTNLTLSLPSSNKIKISWKDNSSGEEGFYIDKKIGELTWQNEFVTIDSNITSYTDDIILPCATVCYRVKAYSNSFVSGYSNVDTINVRLDLKGAINTIEPKEVFVLSRNSFERYALIADNYNGLEIIDCINPSLPVKISNLSLPDRTISIFAFDEYGFVTNHNGEFNVIDISNISSPEIIQSCSTAGPHNDVYISNGFAYMADGEIGLSVLIVSGPPHLLSNCNTNGNAKSVFVLEDHAFIANGLNGGMAIVDVSQPDSSFLVSNFAINGLAQGIFVKSVYAYLANGEAGLEIFDISDVNNPLHISNCMTNGFVYGVYAQDDYVYIADKEKGLIVINVEDKYNPYIMGIYNMTTQPVSIFISGSYAFIADNEGLKIIQVSE